MPHSLGTSALREPSQGVFLIEPSGLPQAPVGAQGIVVRDRAGNVMLCGWVPKERMNAAVLRDAWAHFDEHGEGVSPGAAEPISSVPLRLEVLK